MSRAHQNEWPSSHRSRPMDSTRLTKWRPRELFRLPPPFPGRIETHGRFRPMAVKPEPGRHLVADSLHTAIAAVMKPRCGSCSSEHDLNILQLPAGDQNRKPNRSIVRRLHGTDPDQPTPSSATPGNLSLQTSSNYAALFFHLRTTKNHWPRDQPLRLIYWPQNVVTRFDFRPLDGIC